MSEASKRVGEELPACEREGCNATSVGMVVFQSMYVNEHGIRGYPTWPWQWRCKDHSHKGCLERDLTPEDLKEVQNLLERRVGVRLPVPLVGLSNLSVEQVAKLRQESEQGKTERVEAPPPVTFVSTKEMKDILNRGNIGN